MPSVTCLLSLHVTRRSSSSFSTTIKGLAPTLRIVTRHINLYADSPWTGLNLAFITLLESSGLDPPFGRQASVINGEIKHRLLRTPSGATIYTSLKNKPHCRSTFITNYHITSVSLETHIYGQSLLRCLQVQTYSWTPWRPKSQDSQLFLDDNFCQCTACPHRQVQDYHPWHAFY